MTIQNVEIVNIGDIIHDPIKISELKLKKVQYFVNTLGMPEEEALQFIDEEINLHRSLAENKAHNGKYRRIEYSIISKPLTIKERNFWKRRMEFRTESLKLSPQDARQWTIDDIIGDREFYGLDF